MLKAKFLLVSFVAVVGSALLGLMLSTKTDAANPETITVQVAFVAPITLGAVIDQLAFGSLDVGMLATETVTINLDNTFSEAPAGGVIGGVQTSAKINATATPGRPINILVNPFTNGTNYTLGGWLCDYDGAGAGACDLGSGGLSTTSVAGGTQIRVGVTLTANGGAPAGDDNGNFTLTVAYE